MKILPFNKNTVNIAIKILNNGGVIAHPADTCYGLAGDFSNQNTLINIQEIKGRDNNKAMSIMLPISEKNNISEYAKLDDFSLNIINKLFPGPITILLPKGPKIPKWFFPENNLIGIRIPNRENIENILTSFNKPLITTSANLSGETSCYSSKELINIFKNNKSKPDLIFDEGNIENNLPSTIIKIVNNNIEIIREGELSKKDIEELLK